MLLYLSDDHSWGGSDYGMGVVVRSGKIRSPIDGFVVVVLFVTFKLIMFSFPDRINLVIKVISEFKR